VVATPNMKQQGAAFLHIDFVGITFIQSFATN
jgi:hypothetical protein